MKFFIYLFGVIPIWIGLAVLIGRLLRNHFDVKPVAARLWGFVVSPALMFAMVWMVAAIHDHL